MIVNFLFSVVDASTAINFINAQNANLPHEEKKPFLRFFDRRSIAFLISRFKKLPTFNRHKRNKYHQARKEIKF
jgi:hypothetical protein